MKIANEELVKLKEDADRASLFLITLWESWYRKSLNKEGRDELHRAIESSERVLKFFEKFLLERSLELKENLNKERLYWR